MKIYNGFFSTLVLLITPSSVLGGQDFAYPAGETCGGPVIRVQVTPRFGPPPLPYPKESVEAWIEAQERAEKLRQSKKLKKQLKKQLPSDFDSKIYISLYPDLKKASEKHDDPELWAMHHYIDYGRAEQRAHTLLQFYKEHLPPDFNPKIYISLYPDLKKASKHAEYKEKWGILHYINHGQEEGRTYKQNARL